MEPDQYEFRVSKKSMMFQTALLPQKKVKPSDLGWRLVALVLLLVLLPVLLTALLVPLLVPVY